MLRFYKSLIFAIFIQLLFILPSKADWNSNVYVNIWDQIKIKQPIYSYSGTISQIVTDMEDNQVTIHLSVTESNLSIALKICSQRDNKDLSVSAQETLNLIRLAYTQNKKVKLSTSSPYLTINSCVTNIDLL